MLEIILKHPYKCSNYQARVFFNPYWTGRTYLSIPGDIIVMSFRASCT